MAYDDIRISELPSLPELHANDLFLIQDVTNNLAHRIDWGRLKNSIGRLSKGIIFPLGTVEEPEIAIGDYTSGIMAEDYGTFAIVTHGYKRFKVNQAGTMELINGNVVIGNYDRQCTYSLIVNNLTTFNCYTKFGSDVDVDGNLDVGGNITGGKNLNIPGDVILGESCENSLIINSEIRAMCSMDLKGTMSIHQDLFVDNSATIAHDVSLGSSCSDKLDVYSNAWFRCDLKVDGDLSFGGNLLLDGDVSIGSGCNNEIILNGETTVLCNFRVKGETYLEKDLFAFGNANVTGNFIVSGDTQLGADCNNTTYINSALTAECTSFFRDNVIIGDPNFICPGTPLQVNGTLGVMCDVKADEDLYVDHSTFLGTACSDRLVVEATSQFRCHADFDRTVDITEKLTVAGDLEVNGGVVNIGLTPEQIAVNDCAEINLHGNVIVDCNLFVRGNVLYDGDLEIVGPDITFGAGCGLSTIHLQGETIAHCDVIIEGYNNYDALVVKGNTHIQGTELVSGEFTVAKNSFHDADLRVHEDVLLNKPVTSLNYWEQCECIDGVMWGNSMNPPQGPQTNRAPDFSTEIYGTQKSLCHVYLNDPRWYKANNADPHVQETEIYGSLFARANVDLNSNAAKSADGNHQQKTSVWGQLQQYSVVELNKYIDTGKGHGYNAGEHATSGIGFNILTNKDQTVVHGDANFKKSVILNDGESRLTLVQGKFEAREEARLEKNVHLSGGNTGNSRQCANYSTNIWGKLIQHCQSTLGDDCVDHITMNGSASIMNGVELSNGYGDKNVTGGKDGFFISGGAKCDRNSYHYAVTTVKGDEPISAKKSGINLYVAGPRDVSGGKMTGDLVLTGEAGNGEYKVTSAGNGITVSSGAVNVNQTKDTSQELGFKCSDAGFGGLSTGSGISGSYEPCGGGSIQFDCGTAGLGTHTITGGTGITVSGGSFQPCASASTTITFDPSVLPDPCDKMKPLTINVTGEGTGGGTYNPCTGATITINVNKQEGGDGTVGGSVDWGDITGKPSCFPPCSGTGEPPGDGKLKLLVAAKSGLKITRKDGKQQFSANQATGDLIEWTLDMDPAGCPYWTENISGKKLVLQESGGSEKPGIVMGAAIAQGDASKVWLGIHSNQNNGSFTTISGEGGWKNVEDCGGEPKRPEKVAKVFSVARGLNVLPHHASSGLITNGNATNESVDCFKYGSSDNTDEGSSGINGGAPEGGGTYNRFCFKKSKFQRGELEDITAATDARVNYDFDSLIDSFGLAGDPEFPTGICRWGLKPMAGYESHKYPYMYIDPYEMGYRHPILCDWEPSGESYDAIPIYENDGVTVDYYEHELKSTFDPNTDLIPGATNYMGLTFLSLAGLARHKNKIKALEAHEDTELKGTTTIKGPATFEDIIKIDLDSLRHAEDDQEAANMGVAIGQVYRNGSQLMVRVT